MKFSGKIPFFIVATLTWVVIISSCANQGMPTGGPRDSVPPILVNTQPEYKALNFERDEVELTFSEYILPSKVSEVLVVSPPLTKRPTIRTRSKTLIIKFNEELLDSTTYSLDFKNSVVDNNESNPFSNLRFSFSTGSVYDSLKVAGRVLNAFDLEPVENSVIMLHENLHDSAVFTLRPDFIAKTDETGLFLIDNIRPGKYHLFAVNDLNSDLMYNEGAEEIAFWDTLIVPYAEHVEHLDTLVHGADSMLITGHTHFFPEPVYMRHFTEVIYEQYLDSYNRETRYKCSFIFNESVDDTFNVRLINNDAEDWYIMEPNKSVDSLTMWIADTLVANLDSLEMELSYFQLDSTNQIYLQKDTVDLVFTDKEEDTSKRKRRSRRDDDDTEEEKPEVPQFNWITNIGSTFELNNDILITSPEPIKHFDPNGIKLFLTEDTLKTPLDFKFEKDTTGWRRHRLKFIWEPKTSYSFEIDSAASENIYGITSRKLNVNFDTREDDYYGRIILELSQIESPVIIQLLDNSSEAVITEKHINKDQEVILDFLPPGKYKVKAVFDDNENGKWDTGSFQDGFQPERVIYWNNVLKVRSNWDNSVLWSLVPDLTFNKNIIDQELEEQKRKEAEEEARKEKENEQNQNNNTFQGTQGLGGIESIRK